MSKEEAPQMSSPVIIVKPGGKLAKKLHLSPSRRLKIPAEVIDRMSAAAARVTKALAGEFDTVLVAMRAEARERGSGWRTTVYRQAHDIRGLAKSFNAPLTGSFASELCQYVEALPSPENGDEPILQAYVEAIVSAAHGKYTEQTAQALRTELTRLGQQHIQAQNPA